MPPEKEKGVSVMRIRSRSVLLGLSLVGALVATPGVVAADTPISHSGSVGPHQLADSAEYPGVTCRYNNLQNLYGVRVRAPLMLARDRSSARDRQLVSWRFRLQRATPESNIWTTLYSGPVQRAYALDDASAAFTTQSSTFVTKPANRYRIMISMFWYAPGTTTVQGVANHLIDWYSSPTAPSHGPRGNCPGGIL